MRTGDRTVYKVAQKWEERPGQAGSSWRAEMRTGAEGWRRKVCPVFPLKNGMRFPLAGPTGKCIPQFRVIPGRAFPNSLKAESATHSESIFRDTVSVGAFGKRKGPLCRGPSQFKVAEKGIAPALRACGPLRRFRALRAALANAIAFTQLRALTGFDSTWGPHKRRYEKAIGVASPASQLLSAGSGCHNGL